MPRRGAFALGWNLKAEIEALPATVDPRNQERDAGFSLTPNQRTPKNSQRGRKEMHKKEIRIVGTGDNFGDHAMD